MTDYEPIDWLKECLIDNFEWLHRVAYEKESAQESADFQAGFDDALDDILDDIERAHLPARRVAGR